MKPGDVFGRWTIQRQPYIDKQGRKVADVLCNCGAEKIVRVDGLQSGKSKSCGCFHKERAKQSNLVHGHTRKSEGTSPEFRSWDHMIQRCTNPNSDAYKNYGGAGITVCKRWLDSFQAFLDDMGLRPHGTSLDRVNGAGVYSKETCRWATRAEQADNRSCTRWVELPDTRMSMREAALKFSIKPKTLSARWANGLRGLDLITPTSRKYHVSI